MTKPPSLEPVNKKTVAYTLPVKVPYLFLVPLLVLLVSGCATTSISPEISQPPPGDFALSEVRANVRTYISTKIRWGGTIAGIKNRPTETSLDIVALPLERSGRPSAGDESLGRFIAKVGRFLDPAIYSTGREVTIVGTIMGTQIRPIGEYDYNYVIVDAITIKLWKPPVERLYTRDPFYDPFYGPLWPAPWYAPYPYYPYWR